jgi:hypothetical protein
MNHPLEVPFAGWEAVSIDHDSISFGSFSTKTPCSVLLSSLMNPFQTEPVG